MYWKFDLYFKGYWSSNEPEIWKPYNEIMVIGDSFTLFIKEQIIFYT